MNDENAVYVAWELVVDETPIVQSGYVVAMDVCEFERLTPKAAENHIYKFVKEEFRDCIDYSILNLDSALAGLKFRDPEDDK